MHKSHYSNEKNVQILISLLKQYGIRKIVASPGTTNIPFVASIQCDPWFEIYSSADERSAGYIACGMSAESNEPVVLTCTGATASRNYISALTEAYYSKLPIIAITSTQAINRVGHNIPQVIDRSMQMKDIVKISVQLPSIVTLDDEWTVNVLINKALLEVTRHTCGPVHINLTSSYSHDFSVIELPQTRKIQRVFEKSKNWPVIPEGKVGIFVGNHSIWNYESEKLIEEFCFIYNGIVICDQTSKYHGKHGILGSLLLSQKSDNSLKNFDLLIDIGNISGSYMYISSKNVWRVNPDGEVRDSYHLLSNVFEMTEEEFFKHYINLKGKSREGIPLIDIVKKEDDVLRSKISDLPFSNIWMAQQLSAVLPNDSVLHLGILNSLRSWNFFNIKNRVDCFCNTGGFGIDGVMSALIGASLVNSEKIYFGVIGDLAFFYDLNSLGNKHIKNNLRILLVNNGCGVEFKNYNHFAAMFGDDADEFIAASHHYGNKSRYLVRHYAEDLGFKYISAENKEEFMTHISEFISLQSEKSIIFEVFTNNKCESDALNIVNSLMDKMLNKEDMVKEEQIEKELSPKIKKAIRSVVGDRRIEGIKMIIKG